MRSGDMQLSSRGRTPLFHSLTFGCHGGPYAGVERHRTKGDEGPS